MSKEDEDTLAHFTRITTPAEPQEVRGLTGLFWFIGDLVDRQSEADRKVVTDD